VDEVYAARKSPLPSTPKATTDSGADQLIESARDSAHDEGETMLLSQANGKKMTQALDLPQLEVEMERAIWQVEVAIKKQNEELAKKERGAGGNTNLESQGESGDQAGRTEKKTQ
jgi:hypothetical protein